MHPFVKIVLLIFILLTISFLSNQLVGLLCGLVCVLAASLQYKTFLRVLRRMRWLLISIFIIYAFATPGEYIPQFLGSFSPTYEGCVQGLLQIAKLLIAIASLNMLFSTSSKEHLMAGLYLLLSPLKLLGFNVERFTARLLLTLDYVDEMTLDKNFKLNFHQLDALHEAGANLSTDQVIILQQAEFSIIDKLVLYLMTIGTLIIVVVKVL